MEKKKIIITHFSFMNNHIELQTKIIVSRILQYIRRMKHQDELSFILEKQKTIYTWKLVQFTIVTNIQARNYIII